MLKSLIAISSLAVILALAGCASENKSTETKPETKSDASGTPTIVTSSGVQYGGDMKLKEADTIPVGKLVSDVKSFDGKWVRVSAVVTEVCQAKGCWMRVADKPGAGTVFVKFTCPIDGRLIPLDAVGKKAVVEGTVKLREITEAQARHYAEESGKSAEEVAKIKGPQTELRLWDAIALVEGVKPS